MEMIVRWQVLYRIPSTGRSGAARTGIILTNLGLVVVQGTICYLSGWQNYLVVFGLIYLTGGSLGVWIFVAQHDFEESVWKRDDDWTLRRSPWAGSSFLDLPRVGHWLLNNVSYHHIHHLNPKIPGYNLAACHNSDPIFATAPTIGLRDAWKCWRCQLWDEEAGKLVSVRQAEAGERERMDQGRGEAEEAPDGKSHRMFDALYDGTMIAEGAERRKA
jgi:omega-6 fatty acid desaturase (delta-12 desaturase)